MDAAYAVVLHDAWIACHDADVLIESPSAFAGLHIAEALKIPYFRAFTMPWNRCVLELSSILSGKRRLKLKF
jgi:hypothetical protein